ncbi:hypothetical protein PRZ48_009347 [Zasmidium cellare]|uniref:AAA+ ATPase domain-containing protein n=1 Tax=Zasmidium cellare TaxID=395010 RepID=A0ABR0EBH6_ZASCE|nr:hypothetical protein PRZ48_009347 [Zasmidium cellare]
MAILEEQKRTATEFGNHPLLIHPNGQTLDLASGYIHLLSTFSHEDKAAKGLRKGKTSNEQDDPVYFSALELVRENKILLLSGPSGCGKTTFAKHTCFRIATQSTSTSAPIARNENGDFHDEIWDTKGLFPCYFDIEDAQALETVVNKTIPELLDSATDAYSGFVIVIDTIERAGEEASELLELLVSKFLDDKTSNHRLVLLAEERATESLNLSSGVVRHSFAPLLAAQRRFKISELTQIEPHLVDFALGAAARDPAIFALALQIEDAGDHAEKVLDSWLSKVVRDEKHCAELETYALQQIDLQQGLPSELHTVGGGRPLDVPLFALTTKVRRLLAARHLSRLPAQATVDFYRRDRPADVLRSVIVRLGSTAKFEELASLLLQNSGIAVQRAALLIAEFDGLTTEIRKQVTQQALQVVEEGVLLLSDRVTAAGILSQLEDPRDLTALAFVPAGTFSMGSSTHPNSQPVHEVAIDAFRIGVYPVTVGEYLKFTIETQRQWASPDQHDPKKRNVPATDLTWFDARAYCAWLTKRWHESGKIQPNGEVRLPTEPEWERAARGDITSTDIEHPYIYPWGTNWQPDHCNSEETGLNQPCPVGLFPQGLSTGVQRFGAKTWLLLVSHILGGRMMGGKIWMLRWRSEEC